MRTLKLPTIIKESANAEFDVLIVDGKIEKHVSPAGPSRSEVPPRLWRIVGSTNRCQQTRRRIFSEEAFFRVHTTQAAVSYFIRFPWQQGKDRRG
jgi:hypothetical protein